MPCQHKFIEDLNLERIDFKPTTLIVGTFNPAWPANNQAQWFYGRTQNNNFWDVLPRLNREQSLINADFSEWKAFCKRHKIAITDLICSIEDANQSEHNAVMGGYSDSKIASDFKEHIFIDIIALLQNNPTIQKVFLTRSSAPTFWRRLWRPVKTYCLKNNITEKSLLTPSGYAFYQQGRYNNLHPENRLELNDFILMRWKEKWH